MDYEISKEKGISDYFYCKKFISEKHPPRIHSHFEIIFIQSGILDVVISGKSYTAQAGEMIFIMPYEVHGYEVKEGMDVFVIACPPEYISEYRELFNGRNFEIPCTKFTEVHRAIISDIIKNNFNDDFKKKALVYCAISEFVRNCHLTEKNTFEYDVYRKAMVYISEHYTENITMESVADHVGVTAPHLSRVLNSDDKPGFSEILNSLRIYAAKKMIERENLSVSEVAFSVGYGSIRNFNRVFKQYFGCNPSDLRKNEQIYIISNE